MLHQNWFTDEKRFEMFEDYAESQSFYDTETKNIYVVLEEYGQKGSTIVQEITPESFEYASNIARYNEWKYGWKKTSDGDLKYISPNGNEYWLITLHGWKVNTTYDCVGIFSTVRDNEDCSLFIETMIDYVFGESVSNEEEIKEYTEEAVKKYESEVD